jgi:uncharacterized protein YndB with AHSA1/START domain
MKKVLIALLVIILGFLGFVATRPNTYHVERSTSIAAPNDIVFATIDDLHRWTEWSPWEKLDPQMKRTFVGPGAGPGASYGWAGSAKVGEGRMTITEAQPNQRVVFKLEFIKPFQSVSTATLALVPDGQSTRVTWSLDGNHNFMSKAMCLFVSMDKMEGGDFESGLANLKRVTEADAQAAAAASAPTAPPAGTKTK